MKDWKLGIYVYTDAVVSAPDYAKRLVEETGVDHFIFRAGYGMDIPDSLGKAIEIVRNAKAQVCCMSGTWWGGTIKMLEGLQSKSYESRFPIDMPGSEIDAEIIAKLEKFCKEYKPDAVCLSHARYRHPAYIDAIFDDGSQDSAYLAHMEAAGVPLREVSEARAAWEKTLGASNKTSLLKAADGGLINFLSELSQSSAVKNFFSFRCETVTNSLRAIGKAAKRFEGIAFGSNVYSPIAAEFCGQDYSVWTDIFDFMQPLFPYMEYHHFEPIAAWARYVQKYARLDDSDAIEIAKRLFYMGDTVVPSGIAELDTCGEGNDQQIRSVVEKGLRLTAPYLSESCKLLPILRGVEWGKAVTDILAEQAKSQFGSVIFMGCEYLLSGAPSADRWF
jgi:hypothetical protein